MVISLAMTQQFSHTIESISLPNPALITLFNLSHSSIGHIKVYSIFLLANYLSYLVKMFKLNLSHIDSVIRIRRFSLFLNNTVNYNIMKVYLGVKSNKRLDRLLYNILLWFFTLNFLLIGIVNPSILNPGPSNLSFFYQNVQGLIPFSHLRFEHPSLDINKILELQTFAAMNKPDVVAFNETWLKSSVLDNEIFPDRQYKIFRADRSRRTHPPDPQNPTKFRENGGGVLLGIRSDLNVVSKKLCVPKGIEMLAVQLTFNNGEKAIICTCYRVGNLGIDNCEKIANFLRKLISKRKPPKLYLVGDFNLPHASWDDLSSPVPIEQNFIDVFSELGLKQCITHPTHIKGKILDILLTNADTLVNDIDVRDRNSACKSDHFPISFKVNSRVRYNKTASRKCYNFKKANWDRLNFDLCHTDWSILECCEVEFGWDFIRSHLFHLVDKHIPTVHVKLKFQPPWFDADTYSFCRKKERLRQKFKNTNNLDDELKYMQARRDFKKLVSQKMRDNMSDSDDPAFITKKFWSYVKSSSKSHRIPECVKYGNTLRNKPLDQANLFNTFFHEQFSQPSNYDIEIDYSSDSRFDIDFDHRRVRKLLSKVNSNKAQGPDGIHGKVLKNCALGLAFPLSQLFRLSYNTGQIPVQWKLANVVPVHKKGSKSDVENYRPISLTCLIMKIFERIIKEELLNHTRSFLDVRQHGFLESKSCTTNMVGFCDNLAMSYNENIRTDVVYFDFAKAFDSVNHDIILSKLKHKYRIDGTLLKFLTNYLQDRKQRVVIGNESSEFKVVESGVPQGSILGPILFVIFINDLPEGLSSGTNISLYADDTKVWREIHSEQDHVILQQDIDYLNNWSLSNKMKFHPGKCKVLSVNSSDSTLIDVLPFIQFMYELGGSVLDYTSCEKDLGVDMTPNLNFSSQCDRLYSKANQKLGMIRRNCHFVNDNRRRRVLYITLVRSLFESCSIIWRPLTQILLDKLESIQKRAIKWILHEEYLSYASYTVYVKKCKEADLLPLVNRFELNELVFFHKVMYGLIAVELPFYLSLYQGNSRLRRTHLDLLSVVSSIIPRSSSNPLAKSFFYRTYTLWNQLPLDIRSLPEPHKFKSKVLAFLWNSILVDLDNSVINSDVNDSQLDSG